jgi:hypothetical protein
MAEALPKFSLKQGSIADNALSETAVVAELST